MAILTRALLGNLHRVFDKDPEAQLALRLSYDGSMQWRVEDGVLSTTVLGGSGSPLSIDLNGYTLSALATWLAQQSGYAVPYLNADLADLSALILLDAEGDISQSNGDHLYAYTSLLYAVMEANAWDLKDAQAAIQAMLQQMDINSASGFWLRQWGSRFGVLPLPNEPDNSYGPRIVPEVLRVKSNNRALEQIVQEQTGYAVQIVDIDWQAEYIPTVAAKTNTVGDWTNQAGKTAAPAGNLWGPVPWGWVVKLGLTPVAPGVPPTGGYPYWGPPANNHPMACTFAVLIGVSNAGQISTLDQQKIKNVIEKYSSSGFHALYYGNANILKTNTAGDNVNTLGMTAGPSGGAYTQLAI